MLINLISIATTFLVVVMAFIYFISQNNKFSHLPILFTLCVYFVFFVLTPFINTIFENYVLFNNDVSQYISYANLNYTLSIFFVVVGYMLYSQISINKKSLPSRISLCENNKLINAVRLSFLSCLSFVFLWAMLSDFGIRSLFFANVGNDASLTEFEGSYNYLKLFMESLIVIVALAYVSRMKKAEFIFIFVIVLIVYLAMGFRFRVIVLLLSLGFIYIYSKRFSGTNVIKVIVLCFFLVALMMIQGVYKSYLRNAAFTGVAQVENIESQGSFLNSYIRYTRNHMSFASLIKYIDEGKGEIDYGETILLQPFVRFLPSFVFENNKKPHPKAIVTSANSWGSSEGFYAGEAYGNVGEMYNAGLSFGVIIFSFLFGMLLGGLRLFYFHIKTPVELAAYCCFVASLFHYMTRGYLPGYIMLLGYLVLGYFMVKFFLKIHWFKGVDQ